MARSLFDAYYVCLVVNYLMDGVLTSAALAFGWAKEGNALVQGITPSAILLAKVLGLLTISMAAYFAWRVEPRAEKGIRIIWRSGSGIFGLVSLWNVGRIVFDGRLAL